MIFFRAVTRSFFGGGLQRLANRRFCSSSPSKIGITFELSDGRKLPVQGKIGDSLLDVVIDNSVDIDGFGACEGTLACSTCHIVFSQDQFDSLPNEACDEELDMLDLAYGLTDTSRLGCQIKLSQQMQGWTIHVPDQTLDARLTS